MSGDEQSERVGLGNPHEHGRFRSSRYLLLHAEMRAGHPVTAEAAGSSPVVPAICFESVSSRRIIRARHPNLAVDQVHLRWAFPSKLLRIPLDN